MLKKDFHGFKPEARLANVSLGLMDSCRRAHFISAEPARQLDKLALDKLAPDKLVALAILDIHNPAV